MDILRTHKKMEKAKQEEFQKKLKDIARDFVRFQIDHDARAVVANQFQGSPEYPPNALIDFIASNSFLTWRPMEQQEKDDLNKRLAEDSGIVVPK